MELDINAINDLRETVIFLVEQEKIRGEEIKVLNEKIEALNKIATDSNANFNNYVANQAYEDFKSKYDERLGAKYNDILRKSYNVEDYDATRDAFNDYYTLPEEERNEVSEGKYVEGLEGALENYVAEIKAKLGLAPEQAVTISEDGNGNIEAVTDTNGDGEVDTPVETSSEVGSEKEVEEEGKEESPETSEDNSEEKELEIDPELKDFLNEYLKK